MEATAVNEHDDLEAGQFFDVRLACHLADRPDDPPPLRDRFLAMIRLEPTEVRAAFEGVRADGRLVGAGMILLPLIDNRHLTQVSIWVDPRYRRRGAGRVLLERLTRHARDAERTTLMAQAIGPVPGGPPRDDSGVRFLEAMGFTRALSMLSRRLDLSAVDPSAEQALLDQCLPHAADYRIETWEGTTPQPLAAGVAYLVNRTVSDAPSGDLDIEAPTLDAARLHGKEREFLEVGDQLVGAAAVHRDTGTVAAVTGIGVRKSGEHGYIRTTVAHPGHRGHRLGTIVKIEAHRRIRQSFPKLRYITTSNAETNAHMVQINVRLGYVPYQRGFNYQRELA